MRLSSTSRIVFTLLLLVIASAAGFAQDDVADIPSTSHTLKPETLQYNLISSTKTLQPPAAGYKLLIVLPGGDGGAEFLAFVKRIYKNVLNKDYLAVQLVAPKWAENQRVIWPTEKNKVHGQKVSTEEFIKLAVTNVKKTTKLDDKRVFTLSWSSGGPAAYAASIRKDTPVTGSFVAMSVFKASELPNLRLAKDKKYYILHSQDDQVCPYRMAVAARDTLREAGAKVEFAEYSGGHGWQDDPYEKMRTGIKWLESQTQK